MHPVFSDIRYGPFASTYHAEAMTPEFRESLSSFLEAVLLPQAGGPFESSSGTLMAVYDDQKYCGPNSIVRDIYRLVFAFHRPSGDDTLKCELVFDGTTLTFSSRRGRRLYLWTVARRLHFQKEAPRIPEFCQRIARHEAVEPLCPVCSAALNVEDWPGLFSVRCSEHCFQYTLHRDADGQVSHGHCFLRGPDS